MRASSFPISSRHAALVSAQLTMSHISGDLSESEFSSLVSDLRDAYRLSCKARRLRAECPREHIASLLDDALAGNLYDSPIQQEVLVG